MWQKLAFREVALHLRQTVTSATPLQKPKNSPSTTMAPKFPIL